MLEGDGDGEDRGAFTIDIPVKKKAISVKLNSECFWSISLYSEDQFVFGYCTDCVLVLSDQSLMVKIPRDASAALD